MVQHIEIEELVRLREGGLPTARQKHVRAHLTSCANCRDELDQLAMNDELLADLRELRQIELTPIPKEIDRRLTARLREHLTPRPGPGQTTASRPTRKRPHPDAPRIPDYVLLRRIGEGSFGEVWEAEDLTGHSCAVKILGRQARDYEMKGITRARSVTHPNLVLIRHVGEHKRRRYYVMDFVPGTLSARLHERHQIPAGEAQQIIVSLVEALKACHAAGIAHRDIKPENIGFTADGTLKLLDLGLVTGANRTDGTRIGTPTFMPFMPGKTPAQDDLYAAGLVLYSLLTGKAPSVELLAQAPTAALGDELWRHLYKTAQKAAAPHPDDRFQSAGEFLDALISKLPRKKRPPAPCSPVNGNSETKKRTNIMNSTQQLLTDAATVVGDIGLTQRQQTLRQEAEKLSHPKYKVAVIGQFKAGKSTLINRVFLKENILFTDLMEATAVPTEIERGLNKCLEIYPRTTFSETPDGVGKPIVILDPTTADIKAYTSADDAEKRAELARSTARVRLTWPAESLNDYTIVDTPGINTINEAVAATTYRVIPESDVAVLVTPAQMLTQVDLDFLRGRVFGEGLSRCFVTVNYDPKKSDLSEAELQNVVKTIRAQLQNIGRGSMPVEVVTLREGAGEAAAAGAYEGKLQRFLFDNVSPGRQERARNVLLRELNQSRVHCEIELAALQKTEAEKTQIRRKLSDDRRTMEMRYGDLSDKLVADLKEIHKARLELILRGVATVRGQYQQRLNACKDASEVQEVLSDAPALVNAQLDALLFDCAETTRQQVKQLELKYESSFREITAAWYQSVGRTLDLGDDWAAQTLVKVPAVAWFVMDVVLGHVFIGFWWVADLIARCLLGGIPGLKKLLPSNLVVQGLLKKVSSDCGKQFDKLQADLQADSDKVFAVVEDKLRTAWHEHVNEQVEMVEKPIADSIESAKDPARAAKLQRAIGAIDALVSTVN